MNDPRNERRQQRGDYKQGDYSDDKIRRAEQGIDNTNQSETGRGHQNMDRNQEESSGMNENDFGSKKNKRMEREIQH